LGGLFLQKIVMFALSRPTTNDSTLRPPFWRRHVRGVLLVVVLALFLLGFLPSLRHGQVAYDIFSWRMADYYWQIPLDAGFFSRIAFALLFIALFAAAGRPTLDALLRQSVRRWLTGWVIITATLQLVLNQVDLLPGATALTGLPLVAAIGGVLAWIVTRLPFGVVLARWAHYPLLRHLRWWHAALLLGVGFGWFSSALLYHWHPLIVDAQSQIAQARLLARGQFKLEVPPALRPAIVFPVCVPTNPTFAQYPPGYLAPLAVMLRLGLPLHLLDLFAVAITFWLTAWLAGRLVAPALQRRARWVALLLISTSPFVMLLSGTMMNHVLCACLLLIALCSALQAGDALRAARPARAWLALCGLALGWILSTRPLNGVLYGIVFTCAALWYAARFPSPVNSLRGSLLRMLRYWPAVAGALPPLLGFCYYNLMTTGHPLHLAYTLADPLMHRIGFVPLPDGTPFTLWISIQRSLASMVSLNIHLLGWFTGSWLGLLACWFYLRNRPLVWVCLALLVMQVLGYGYYHFHDLVLGPRFWYEFVPLLLAMIAAGAVTALQCRALIAPWYYAALLLIAFGGGVSGFTFWREKHYTLVARHDAMQEFLANPALQYPAVIVIGPRIAETTGVYFLGEPNAPIWFLYRDQADKVRHLPALAGYHWYDYAVN
jgi:hypothetical protein